MRFILTLLLFFTGSAFAEIDMNSSAHPHSAAAFEGASVLQAEADPELAVKDCPYGANNEDQPGDQGEDVSKVQTDSQVETIK